MVIERKHELNKLRKYPNRKKVILVFLLIVVCILLYFFQQHRIQSTYYPIHQYVEMDDVGFYIKGINVYDYEIKNKFYTSPDSLRNRVHNFIYINVVNRDMAIALSRMVYFFSSPYNKNLDFTHYDIEMEAINLSGNESNEDFQIRLLNDFKIGLSDEHNDYTSMSASTQYEDNSNGIILTKKFEKAEIMIDEVWIQSLNNQTEKRLKLVEEGNILRGYFNHPIYPSEELASWNFLQKSLRDLSHEEESTVFLELNGDQIGDVIQHFSDGAFQMFEFTKTQYLETYNDDKNVVEVRCSSQDDGDQIVFYMVGDGNGWKVIGLSMDES